MVNREDKLKKLVDYCNYLTDEIHAGNLKLTVSVIAIIKNRILMAFDAMDKEDGKV